MVDHPKQTIRPLDIVLDTNVVLDWLLFEDPAVALIETAPASRSMRVLTCEYAIEELQRVLSYPKLAVQPARQESVMKRYRERTWRMETPLGSASEPLRCRDADDQYLLTLAFAASADALVSRDRELLSLRTRARALGLDIFDVAQFAACLMARQAC